MTRQEFMDALKEKLTLTASVEDSIRTTVLTSAHKLLMKGVDRFTFIQSMDKMYRTMGQAGREVIVEIGQMTEFKEWRD